MEKFIRENLSSFNVIGLTEWQKIAKVMAQFANMPEPDCLAVEAVAERIGDIINTHTRFKFLELYLIVSRCHNVIGLTEWQKIAKVMAQFANMPEPDYDRDRDYVRSASAPQVFDPSRYRVKELDAANIPRLFAQRGLS